MARPPLELGTYGEIRTYYRLDGGKWRPGDTLPDDVKAPEWKAVAQFRDWDGNTRQVERSSTTEAKAKAALKERAGTATGDLNAGSRVHHAIDLYLAEAKRTVVDTS
ncbi:hypothetical protein [Actinocrispum wychmicini]|nr:hypothetical protein [Actinocrispum wychmicini]